MPRSIIIGAGWSGLSCAYHLVKAKHEVIVFEAAPNIGGRARSVNFGNNVVDNGQHIALGSYHMLRTILAELKLNETELFHKLPIEIYNIGNVNLHMRIPYLPLPLNLLFGIFTAKISWRYKYQIFKFIYSLRKKNFTLLEDCTVEELLLNYNQSTELINILWEPIAVAAMSTPIEKGSAQIFVNIIKQAFFTSGKNCYWFLPKVDLSNILPNQLADYIELSGGRIFTNTSIAKLECEQNICTSIISNKNNWQADNIIIATSPWRAAKLLSLPELHDLNLKLQKFKPEIITTIYLEFNQSMHLQYPMQSLQNCLAQWIFDRNFAGQPNILAIIITGNLPAKFADNALLISHILQELKQNKIELSAPKNYKVIREKQAAFSCTVDIQAHRPLTKTKIRNLWLCGDYINNGLPSTLEGALLNGYETARSILN